MINNLPYQTVVLLTAATTRRLLSELADTATEGFYAHAVEKTADQTAFQITFYSFNANQDESELRGRLIIGAEFMDIHDLHIISVTTTQCADKNWLEEVHQAFPPRQLGDFFVYGSHYTGDIDKNLIPLKIDAATAFGSGEHDTTQLCLERLCALKANSHDFTSVLDMGCGSSILAIGAQKLWPSAKVIATDIDPESVRVSIRHAEMNEATRITFDCGDGYKLNSVQNAAPYDLVIANILTRPLIAMAPEISDVCQKSAKIVLSGLLDRQADSVIQAHQENGFVFLNKTEQNGWACLLMEKS